MGRFCNSCLLRHMLLRGDIFTEGYFSGEAAGELLEVEV